MSILAFVGYVLVTWGVIHGLSVIEGYAREMKGE